MQSYRDLKEQIQELQKQAELARTQELASAVKEIQKLIEEFDLMPEDLFSERKLKLRRGKRRGPATVSIVIRSPAPCGAGGDESLGGSLAGQGNSS